MNTPHSYRCLWRNSAWKLLWLERNETRSGCLQTERVLMKIWETKCHVWLDTETNREKTLYKHTSQRHACKQTSKPLDEENLFSSALHFPFFISPSTLHHSTCVRCCRGNGLQRCVFIRGQASFNLLSAFWNRIKQVGEKEHKREREREMEINHLSPCSPFHLSSYEPQCFNFLFVSGHDPLYYLTLW